MSTYSRGEVVLVRYPFSDLSGAKIRPAVVVSATHISQDLFIVPLTSRTTGLLPGEFIMRDWAKAGLNVETAVKRGVYTIRETLIARKVGKVSDIDLSPPDQALKVWLGL